MGGGMCLILLYYLVDLSGIRISEILKPDRET